jgi:chromosome segregation ATPase
VIPESDVEAPRPPKPIRFRQFVEARFQPRPDTPELKRKRIPCGSPGPAIPCAKRPRLEEHNTDTVPQDLPTPTEDEDVPNVHRGEGEASDTHSRRPPSLVRHTENFEVALHSKPSPSSSSIPSPLSLSSFSSLPSSRTGQVAWKPTDFEPDQVDHVAQKQPETELNQLRKRLSFTEKALQQAQQDCNQERLARQATERNLFEAQDDRNRERVAQHTAERARALGEKALSEANATRERSTLQLTDKIDALQETICDLEASLDRNASNYETALTDLASKHEDTVSDLEQKLEACAAGRKTDHEKLVVLHRGLQEKLVVLQRELEVSNGIRKGAAKTIADQQGQLEIFEEFRKDAAKALKVSRDDLESSEDKRKAAVQRADHLQKELTDCEAREGEVNYILDTTIIEHNNAQAFLQQKLQDTEVSCQNAIGRADNLQAKLKGMDEKYEIANNRAQQLQSDLGIAQARLVEAVNTSDATRIELDMAVAKLDDKGKECETITKRAEQLDSALRLSEVQRLELQKSFDINSSKSSSQIRELTTQLQDMEQKYITAIARAEQLQRDLDLAEEFRLAADERNEVEADLERQLHEMEEKWKTSSRQADTLQVDLKGSQAEFEATRAELKTTQAELIESDVRRRGSVAKVEDLKKQLQDIEEKSKAESQRADQMQGELKLCETRRQAEATEHHSLAADLRKQLQDMKGHHKAAAQQAAQLTKELQAQRAVSEQQRADADARIAELEDLRTQVQQSDVTFKAATQRITQQADELQLSHELYRRLEGEMELLREKHMALLITEMAKAQRIEQLQEALNRAEEGHLRAKIAQLRAEEGQLRAVTQLAEAQDQLADARAQQCESTRLAEMVERDVASLMTERDEALKARDDARVMAFFKIRELRDELAEIKKRYRRQETAIRLVATELLVNTRTRFAFHRDLMGVPKLQPDRSDGWICWKGLPDGLDNAKLERDLGPLNMGWLRIAISLLKEAECIVKFWHKVCCSLFGLVLVQLLTLYQAAINWQSVSSSIFVYLIICKLTNNR